MQAPGALKTTIHIPEKKKHLGNTYVVVIVQ